MLKKSAYLRLKKTLAVLTVRGKSNEVGFTIDGFFNSIRFNL